MLLTTLPSSGIGEVSSFIVLVKLFRPEMQWRSGRRSTRSREWAEFDQLLKVILHPHARLFAPEQRTCHFSLGTFHLRRRGKRHLSLLSKLRTKYESSSTDGSCCLV